MRNNINNNIIAVWLLAGLVLVFSQSKPQLPLNGYIEGNMRIVGNAPKIGEIFDVVYQITTLNTKDWTIRKDYLIKDYAIVMRAGYPEDAVEIIGDNKLIFSGLTPGEQREFHIKCCIIKPVNRININGDIHIVVNGEMSGPITTTHGFLFLYLIDPISGQYGTSEEYEGKLPVEYRYDPLVGTFTCSPSRNPAPIGENREIIKLISQLEPALSDSEIFLLHSEQYKVGVPKDVSKWDEKEKRWTEEKIFEYYLKDGWLKALRYNNLPEWELREKTKIDREWKKEGSFNFFRDGYNRYDGDSIDSRASKTFYGHWHFKHHYYNKDQGLLSDAKRDTIKQCRARCLIRYTEGSNVYYSYFNTKTVTNDSGYFFITIDVDQNWTGCRVYPVLFPCGPDVNSPVINVSDPNNTLLSFWKDPDDTTLYVMREDGTGIIHTFTPDTTTLSLGWIWTDTFPQYTQPHGGCINIYETYRHARTFMDPPPSWPLRVMWEPGYDSGTCYGSNIIWIHGDTSDTDEWDDDVLLHEYGHYLMDNYAEFPLNLNADHYWYLNDTIYPNTAYCEGWASLFSGRARVGSEADSLHIDNKYIGSGSAILWLNFENPWLGSYYDTTSFQGGPYCEGAVCGSLWDIYDSKNEIPYHSYPDTLDGVWFPDSALKDSLTMGFDEIWYIFDNYDPAGTPTNCWTIYDFRSGWNTYNYDHAFALNQILLHHRIRDSVPAAPTGLSATQVQYYARLWWNMNSETDLEGYRIYRRYSDGYDWSEWAFLTDKTSPTDTTHDDFTVQAYRTYQYKLTAYDSLRNESAYSDSFEIYIDYWWNPDRVDPTVHLPTIITDKYGMELSLTSGSCDVELKVYDCCGRLVNQKTIKLTANNYTKINLRTDARNNRLPCGIYFLSIEFDKNETVQRKFIILK